MLKAAVIMNVSIMAAKNGYHFMITVKSQTLPAQAISAAERKQVVILVLIDLVETNKVVVGIEQ